jgi:polyhydroxyalkanoate synthesis regulator phasin
MIGFREYLTVQADLEEGLVRKGAVAVYAAQGKRHGDEAVRHYQQAKQALAEKSKKDAEQKVAALAQAISSMIDGLMATRMQIGSVSAQVTSLSLL